MLLYGIHRPKTRSREVLIIKWALPTVAHQCPDTRLARHDIVRQGVRPLQMPVHTFQFQIRLRFRQEPPHRSADNPVLLCHSGQSGPVGIMRQEKRQDLAVNVVAFIPGCA